MTVRDFLKDVENARGLLGDLMDEEVEIQMHTPDGKYIGNSFAIDRCGYKFSPLYKRENGKVVSALVLDVRILNRQ
jgi:hypothetical protein